MASPDSCNVCKFRLERNKPQDLGCRYYPPNKPTTAYGEVVYPDAPTSRIPCGKFIRDTDETLSTQQDHVTA